MEAYLIPCLFLKFTGIPCPGCGGQRALIQLIKGNLSEAFEFYPAIFPLVIFGFLLMINFLKPFKQFSSWSAKSGYFTIGVVLIQYGFKLFQTLI